MKVWVRNNTNGAFLVTRIDDAYLMEFEFSDKSFIEPCSMTDFEVGLCYSLVHADKYKIADGTELCDHDQDVQNFARLIAGLERLPHKGFVLDYLRAEADKVARLKKRLQPSKGFWRHKTEYWPWFLNKAVDEAAKLV